MRPDMFRFDSILTDDARARRRPVELGSVPDAHFREMPDGVEHIFGVRSHFAAPWRMKRNCSSMSSSPAYWTWVGIGEKGQGGDGPARGEAHLPERRPIDARDQFAVPQIGLAPPARFRGGWRRPCRGTNRHWQGRTPGPAVPRCRDSGGKKRKDSDGRRKAAPARRRHDRIPAARSASRSRKRGRSAECLRQPAGTWHRSLVFSRACPNRRGAMARPGMPFGRLQRSLPAPIDESGCKARTALVERPTWLADSSSCSTSFSGSPPCGAAAGFWPPPGCAARSRRRAIGEPSLACAELDHRRLSLPVRCHLHRRQSHRWRRLGLALPNCAPRPLSTCRPSSSSSPTGRPAIPMPFPAPSYRLDWDSMQASVRLDGLSLARASLVADGLVLNDTVLDVTEMARVKPCRVPCPRRRWRDGQGQPQSRALTPASTTAVTAAARRAAQCRCLGASDRMAGRCAQLGRARSCAATGRRATALCRSTRPK